MSLPPPQAEGAPPYFKRLGMPLFTNPAVFFIIVKNAEVGGKELR